MENKSNNADWKYNGEQYNMYIAFEEVVDGLRRKTELIDVYKIANDLVRLLLKKRERLPQMLQKSVVFSSFDHCFQHSFEFFEVGY